MTMIEKRAESIRKEIEKLSKSLETHKERLEKKTAKAAKMNAIEYNEKWDTEGERINECMLQRTPENAKAYGAWWALHMEKGEIEDLERRIANAESRLAKILPKAEAEAEKNAEDERIEKMENKFFNITHKTAEQIQAEYEAWLREFKAECLKDGVVIEQVNGWAITGKTKSGKQFGCYGNSGWTERSKHCYTLYIDRKMIFTSGDFTTCYRLLKR